MLNGAQTSETRCHFTFRAAEVKVRPIDEMLGPPIEQGLRSLPNSIGGALIMIAFLVVDGTVPDAPGKQC